MSGTIANGIATVKIPQFILEGKRNCWTRTYNAYAWVYISDGVSGQTEYKIIFEIKARPKPDDYVFELEEIKDKLEELKEKIANAGEVKTVNNVKADENGNVDLTQSIEEIAMDLLVQMEVAPVVLDADGAIFVDADGSILLYGNITQE